MQNDITDTHATEWAWVQSIRTELRASRQQMEIAASRRLPTAPRNDGFDTLRQAPRNDAVFAKHPVTVNVEDAIFTRLVEAEELLAVAVGLFTELAEDKGNWLFNFKDDIVSARWALRNLINDRKFG